MKKLLLPIVLWLSIILAGCGTTDTQTKTAASPIAKFANCIKDSWAKFYGTTWCSHCKDQKAKFGDSAELLPFVDCDKNGAICEKAWVKWYPTWSFSNWSKLEWAQEFVTLASKTSCQSPL